MSDFEKLYNQYKNDGEDPLEEGLLDRIKARGAGVIAGGKQLGRNVKNVAKAGIHGAIGNREGMEKAAGELKNVNNEGFQAKYRSVVKSFIVDMVKTKVIDRSLADNLYKGIINYIEDNYETDQTKQQPPEQQQQQQAPAQQQQAPPVQTAPPSPASAHRARQRQQQQLPPRI